MKKLTYQTLIDIITRFGLTILVVVVFVTNYRVGTYLVGWDNVFPELNFAHAFNMNLHAVWQAYRGLGVTDGLSHAANIVHTTFLYLLSYILPQHMLRYVFHIVCLGLGGAGMQRLLKEKLHFGRSLAFVGGLFYMTNLVTVQMFFAPLEVFSTHFAALPWIVYTTLRYLYAEDDQSRRDLLILFGVSFLFSPQGFVPTVFIAMSLLMFSVVFGYWMKHKDFASLRRAFVVLCVFIAANAFWILPYGYSALSQSDTIKNTKINQLSSDVIFERNKHRGGLMDTLMLRGFMLDVYENDKDGQYKRIMDVWVRSSYSAYGLALGFVSIFFLGVGIVSQINKRYEYTSFFSFAFIVSFIFLATDTPLLRDISAVVRTVSPILGEAFRFPFTKLSLVYVFCFTIFLVHGLEFFSRRRQVLIYGVCLLILLNFVPAIGGEFFFDSLRLSIPQGYFDVISYFKDKPQDARIATLPQPNYTNWGYYRWGARGSGFLWYGIAQPMLERPFDPWSIKNEQYYNELSYALNTYDSEKLSSVVRKYGISYFLYDDQIKHSLKLQEKDKIFALIQKAFPDTTSRSFGNLTVFDLPDTPYIRLSKLTGVSDVWTHALSDKIYTQTNGYYAATSSRRLYLFPSLYTDKRDVNHEFHSQFDSDMLVLSPRRDAQLIDKIIIPRYSLYQSLIPVSFTLSPNNLVIRPLVMTIKVDTQTFDIVPIAPHAIDLEGKGVIRVKLNGAIVDPYSSAQLHVAYTQRENILTFETIDGDIFEYVWLPTERIFASDTLHFTPTVSDRIVVSFPTGMIATPPTPLTPEVAQSEAPCGTNLLGRWGNEYQNGKMHSFVTQNATCTHLYVAGGYKPGLTSLALTLSNVQGIEPELIVDQPQTTLKLANRRLSDGHNLLLFPYDYGLLDADIGVHLFLQSPNRYVASFDLDRVQSLFVPTAWLEAIRVTDVPLLEPTSKQTPRSGNYTIHSSIASFGQVQNVNVLSSNTAYDKGWFAYDMTSASLVQQLIPPVFASDRRLSDHVMVNNWANGWLVKSNQTERTYMTLYVPQYLQFVGYGISILLGVSLLFNAVFKRR